MLAYAYSFLAFAILVATAGWSGYLGSHTFGAAVVSALFVLLSIVTVLVERHDSGVS